MFQLVALTKRNRYVGTFAEGDGAVEKATAWLLSHFPRAAIKTWDFPKLPPWEAAKQNGQ